MRARAAVPAALIGALLATTALGCFFGATPHIRYYTLTVTSAPPVRLPAPVVVAGFTADQPYATERIAFRTSPYRLDYYIYHRWAADPRNLVRAVFRDYFERGNPGTGLPFELEGNIRAIEEVDDPARWRGALTLDVKVARGGTVVLQRAYAETEPAEAHNPEAVAAALSRALQRILDQIATELVADTGRPLAPAPPPRRQ